MNHLKDKTVFITGASSGIGSACAEYFAKAGARLLLCSRRLQVIRPYAEALHEKFKVKIHAFSLDVRDATQVKQALEVLPKEWKNIDILINSAGLAAGLDTLQEGDIADWDAMIDTNIKGLLYVTRQILPGMIEKNSGHIINIGSIAGHQVYPKGAVYCASKFAVKALSEGLRLDLFGTKIRVTSIDPGAVESNFSQVRFKGDTKRAQAVYEGYDALTPNDIADLALYCASCPPHVNVSDVIIMPVDQASATMFSREK